MKKAAISLVVVLILGSAGWWLLRLRPRPAGPASAPPAAAAVPVRVVPVVRKAVPVEIRTFGTVEAYSTVTVRPQITGVLTNVYFQEGADVQAADLLFAIDARPWETAIKEAEATLERDRVHLANAGKDVQRQEALQQKGFTSEEARDKAATAQGALLATVKGDEAVLDNARLQLGYCTIRAPIGGRTGTIAVHPGNVVRANETPLVTLLQMHPILVSFAVPQTELPAIRRQSATGTLTVRAFFENDPQAEEGELCFIDNQVRAMTGTILLKAAFLNKANRLWPGQFVTVRLTVSIQQDACIIPSSAVQSGQRGTYVFVVKPDQTVTNQPVTIDRTIGEETVIASGLEANDRVVTEGQLRLRPGITVQVK